MDEKIQDTANEALRAIIDNATSAKEFILSELPEVIEQLLMWKTTESIISIVFMLLSVAILALVIFTVIRCNKFEGKGNGVILKETGPLDFFLIIGLMILAGLSVLALFSVYFDLSRILQIYIAPKVYLLEYASKLIN